MKQYIEVEQFSELSLEARKKLHLWLLEHDYPTLYIAIGQMIEFLDEHKDEHQYWWTEDIIEVKAEFLCDEIWKEVKRILET